MTHGNDYLNARTLLDAASRRCPGPERGEHKEVALVDLAADLCWPAERATAAADVLIGAGNDRVNTGLGEPAELITIDCCAA